jgi:hypothetical protein
MSDLIVKDKLHIGVTVDGNVYKDFSMRPATLRDSCDAVNAVGGTAAPNILRYATMAQRTSFDGLPQEQVTVELLMGLFDRDAVVLEDASDKVEKKLDELSSS